MIMDDGGEGLLSGNHSTTLSGEHIAEPSSLGGGVMQRRLHRAANFYEGAIHHARAADAERLLNVTLIRLPSPDDQSKLATC